MSEEGVFAVHRGIFKHPMFAPEPFTEREAWLWMLSAAAWADKRVRVGKAMVDLKRGQLAFATRFLADKWQWAHSKVVRFLKRLKTDTMIGTLAKREATLITICNYDAYQFGGNATETQAGTSTGTEVKRERNKEEETNNLITESSRSIEADRPVRVKSRFEDFWKAYPRRDGPNPRKPAEQKFNALVKSGVDPEMMIAAARQLSQAESAKGNVGTRFIPMASTWLNQQRWADHAAMAFLASETEMPIEDAVKFFAKVGRWSRWAGPEPGQLGCKASDELLAKHGLAPDGRKLETMAQAS